MPPRTRWLALLALLALLAPVASLRAAPDAPRATPTAGPAALFLPLISVSPPPPPAPPPPLQSVRLVTDIASQPQPHGSNPTDLVVVGDSLYFVAEAELHGREVWKSNGTQATRLTSFNPLQEGHPKRFIADGARHHPVCRAWRA